MAYHHSVVVKLKKRLIVLMMLDSPADLYQNDDQATLSQYMRQYTYIDYMADDWLDKLLYALPLRGLLHDSEDHGASDGASIIEKKRVLVTDLGAQNFTVFRRT